MTTTWTLREIPELESLDSPGAWLLRGHTAANNAVLLDAWGTHDFDRDAHEILGSLHDQAYVRKIRVIAVADDEHDAPDPDRVLGYAAMNLPLHDNTQTMVLDLGVRPEHRRRGIGSALHDAALERADRHGRTTIQTSTDQRTEPADGPDTLAPTSGEGRVSATSAANRFATSRGYQLEQVARLSVINLPLDPDLLDHHRALAQRHAGPDYRLVSWESHCPEEWLDEYAQLAQRMSTDAPVGGLDLEEDVWDGDRIRTTEKQLQERRMRLLVMAVEHVPTHTLAGFTEFMTMPNSEVFAHQHDTLVLKEHRGRRLGMLVKAANLQRLAQDCPDLQRVGTWNAEENSYMLHINVALGFRPAGGAGEWQLRRAAG